MLHSPLMDPFENVWIDPEPTSPPVPGERQAFNYPPSLPHDLACAMTPEEVDALKIAYALSDTEFDYIVQRPDFKREYTEWRQKLISEGNSFKLKLRAMAEDYLPRLHQIMHSDLTSPSVKVDAFKYITKVAELEPKPDQNNREQAKVVIEIANFSTPQTPSIINVTPVPPLPQQNDA